MTSIGAAAITASGPGDCSHRNRARGIEIVVLQSSHTT